MSSAGPTRRKPRAAPTDPIKSHHSRRGFIIGWVVIFSLGAGSYAFAASQLSPSSAELRLTTIGSENYSMLAPQ